MSRFGIVIRAVIGWAVALAVVLAAFGLPLVIVTGWMFGLITDGSKGLRDTLLRLLGAILAAPIVGFAAGVTCAAIVGVPAFALLQKLGITNPLRRRRKAQQPPVPPSQLPPPPPLPYFMQQQPVPPPRPAPRPRPTPTEPPPGAGA